jgi:hypothetical protein
MSARKQVLIVQGNYLRFRATANIAVSDTSRCNKGDAICLYRPLTTVSTCMRTSKHCANHLLPSVMTSPHGNNNAPDHLSRGYRMYLERCQEPGDAASSATGACLLDGVRSGSRPNTQPSPFVMWSEDECPRQDSNLTRHSRVAGSLTCGFCALACGLSTSTCPAVYDTAGHIVLFLSCKSCAGR